MSKCYYYDGPGFCIAPRDFESGSWVVCDNGQGLSTEWLLCRPKPGPLDRVTIKLFYQWEFD